MDMKSKERIKESDKSVESPNTYKFASFEGIDAILMKIHDSGHPYQMDVSGIDISTILHALKLQATKGSGGRVTKHARKMLAEIAISVGVQWDSYEDQLENQPEDQLEDSHEDLHGRDEV